MLSPGKGGAAPVYGHALGHATYERHRPEQTLLYQLVEKHYPALVEQLAFQGKSLPTHVHREFEAYLKCGRLEHGFLRVRCDKCHFERLVAFSCKQLRLRIEISRLSTPPSSSIDFYERQKPFFPFYSFAPYSHSSHKRYRKVHLNDSSAYRLLAKTIQQEDDHGLTH